MAERFTGLRKLGDVGAFIANVLVFLTTNWPLVVTIIVSIYAGISDWAVATVHKPSVYVTVGVFLSVLWTYIGLTFLIDRRKPRLTQPAQDYRYGLVFEGCVPVYEAANEDAALQIGLQLRNFSSGPIRYSVEHFDVRIGSRTLPKLKKGALVSYLPRGAGRTSSNVPFKKEDIIEYAGRRVEGTVEFSIAYGHPEQPPERRLKMVMDVIFVFNASGALGFGGNITEESDEPISIL